MENFSLQRMSESNIPLKKAKIILMPNQTPKSLHSLCPQTSIFLKFRSIESSDDETEIKHKINSVISDPKTF